jgi:hypothetical protein
MGETPVLAALLAASLGALAGAVEGVVIALIVAPYQQRRGVKSSPAIPGHLVCGGFVGGLSAGITRIGLPFVTAVGIGAAAWPVVFGILWLALRTRYGRDA